MPAMTKTSLLAAALLVGIACNESTSPPPPVTVPPAARLAFAVQPGNATAGVAISPAVTVTIQDAAGNTTASATDLVTVALGTNPGGGTLSGTTAVNAVNGVATFSKLSIEKASTRYTLTASSGTLTAAISAPFAIAPAAPAQLAFAVQPSSTLRAQPITPAVQVAIQDAFANTVTSATNAVTLSLATNPGSGTLVGTKTVNALGGIATFSALSIDQGGTGYTLAATSVTLSGATSAPFEITLPLSFAAVSAGGAHTCGVTPAGDAYCWGSNADGELGTGTTNFSLTPVAVAGGYTFAALSAGQGLEGADQTCGVTIGGAAYCWGWINGTATSSSTPLAVAGGLAFKAVSAGVSHTCAVTAGGAAYCWGYNGSGQLGNGTTTSSSAPVAVAGGYTFSMVSAGDSYTCGVTTSGAAYCWGQNGGLLGTGTTKGPEQCPLWGGYVAPCSTTPVAVAGGLAFVTVSASDDYTCGVTTSGAAYCWGDNGFGQLGTGTTTSSSTPVAVAGGHTFSAVSTAAGFEHTCGVSTSGAAYCWGDNHWGELGDGTSTSSSTPVAVLGSLTFVTVSGGGYYISLVDYGSGHTCGITTGSVAYCWGGDALGNGTTTSSDVPVKVAGQP